MKIETCALTPKQEKLWGETRVALLWHCPGFSHILYSMLDNSGSSDVAIFTRGVPIAATDGSSLMLNPDTFFNYKLGERVFICAHEIMHCILGHCEAMHGYQQRGKVDYPDGKSIPYDQQLMNVAADLVINDLLITCSNEPGQNAGDFNSDWLHDPTVATGQDSVINAYRTLFDDRSSGGGGSNPGGGKSFDQHHKPGTSQGKDATQAAQERNDAEWQTAIAGAANAARAQGKLPGALDRALSEVLNPKVDWQDVIKALFARRVGSGTYDWRTVDRRLITRDIVAPGRSGHGADTVVVAVDTSGSVRDSQLSIFFAEMSGILEDVNPRRMIVLWCDAHVHRADEIADTDDLSSLRHKKAPGGGGTSFTPVFDWLGVEGIEPDCLVYLTDGLGSFPGTPPSYPTIWGSIYDKARYPFGDVVDISALAA